MTIVSGDIRYRNGVPTDSLPGRLIGACDLPSHAAA